MNQRRLAWLAVTPLRAACTEGPCHGSPSKVRFSELLICCLLILVLTRQAAVPRLSEPP